MRNSTRYARSARGSGRDNSLEARRRRTAMGFPQRGDLTLRSVGEEFVGPPAPAPDPAGASLELAAKLKAAKDVVVNTVESVYPWMGFTAAVLFRQNALIRYGAPVVGIAIGVARAMTHTDDKIVAKAADDTLAEADKTLAEADKTLAEADKVAAGG